ncbi:MAG: hypothetical protein PVG39_22115 [Desulfobacteraceae bacterium]|jgi:hypothetical protein
MKLTPSDYAAWTGLGLATIVALWDVYKWWRDRPRFSIKPDVPTYADLEKSGNFLSLGVEIINGQFPVSIRFIHLHHYKNILQRFFHRPDQTGKLTRKELPKPLNAAEVWSFYLDEFDDDFCLSREDLTSGILILEIYGTNRRRPVSIRLSMEKDKPNKALN